MRILYNKGQIEEIIKIFDSCLYSTDCKWETTKENPTDYMININGEWAGHYKLDGTIETYKKAQQNYTKICENLLVKGYCRADDFKNFEWF